MMRVKILGRLLPHHTWLRKCYLKGETARKGCGRCLGSKRRAPGLPEVVPGGDQGRLPVGGEA